MYVLCGCMCCLEKTSPTLSACWNGKRSDRFDDLPRQRVIECSSHIWHICKWVLRTAGVTRQIYTTVFHDFASNQITTFALCVQLKLEVAHSLFLVSKICLYGGWRKFVLKQVWQIPYPLSLYLSSAKTSEEMAIVTQMDVTLQVLNVVGFGISQLVTVYLWSKFF